MTAISRLLSASRRRVIAAMLCAATLVTPCLVDAAGAAVASGRPETSAAANALGTASANLEFEVNRGQFDPQVRYVGHGGGATLFLTATEAVYVLPVVPATRAGNMLALRMQLVGANAQSAHGGEAPSAHRSSYLHGNDPAGWHADIPNFTRVRYAQVYDGVAMVWRGRENATVQYDFEIDVGADPGQIRLQFAGADALDTDIDGALLIHTAAGIVKQSRPSAYQDADGMRQPVASAFVVEGNSVRFGLGHYDHAKPLTIDPSVSLNNLAFSTFLGGSGNDQGLDVAVDALGNVYVTGFTQSVAFPTTAGVFDGTYAANDDVFVTKLNGSGGSLIYSTFIGGTGSEQGRAIAIDRNGNAFLSGQTTSSGFPVTAGSFDTTYTGSSEAFVLKLNAGGTALVYSSFLGSSGYDEAFGVAIDSSNNVYVTGRTADGAQVFPTTASAFDTTFNGVNDVFVSKLDASGASLLYSTFLGGALSDFGVDLVADDNGIAWVTGYSAKTTTPATDYPTTAGAFATLNQGGNDMIVSKLNTLGTGASSLVYSTFIGGTDSDSANGIAVDATGQAVITGSVLNGGGYPVTVGAYDTSQNGAVDVVVTKLNASGSALLYSTYIGGNGTELGYDIALDRSGIAYITGYTINSGTDYPTTTGAYATLHSGGHDVFMSRLSANGSALLYSTLLGGLGDDDGSGLAIDAAGNVYLTGLSNLATPGFPVSIAGFQRDHNGGTDAFVSKFGNFAISGQAIDAATGNPMAGVMVALSGLTSEAMLTGPDGRFGFTNTVDYSPYAIAASRANYNVNPNIFVLNSLDANRELIFIAAPGLPSGIADLAISKSDGVGSVPAGGSLTYTTLASNLAGSDITGGTVTDTFPAELTCTWTCVGVGGGRCTPAGVGAISDNVNLPAGGSAIYTARCDVSTAAAGTLTNTATVAPPGSVNDPVPDNNIATDVDLVLPAELFRDGFE